MAHFSLLSFLVMLFVRLLMLSDTSSCNTDTNLSPLAAAPTTSNAEPCRTSCSLGLFLTVSKLLLKYLAPTPAHEHVLPFFCLAGNILAWQYKLEKVEVLQNQIWLLKIFYSRSADVWGLKPAALRGVAGSMLFWRMMSLLCSLERHHYKPAGDQSQTISISFKSFSGWWQWLQMVVSSTHSFRIDSHLSLSVSLAAVNNIFSAAAPAFCCWMLQGGIVQKSITLGLDHNKHARRKSVKLIAYSV